MTKLNDPDYLRNQQYKDASNLDARAALHERFSTNPQDWFGWVIEQIKLPDECRILELGCGPGDLWRNMLKNVGAERLPAGWQLTLSDFSEGMLEQARKKLDGRGVSDFRVIDAQAIPFEDAHFDVVIANHMLYHVPDRQRALREIRRVLRPGGRLYATTVGEQHMRELLAISERFDPTGQTEQMKMGGEFSLESGLMQLKEVFSSVCMRRYRDSLHVTEAAPLAAYLMSSARFTAQKRQSEQEFRSEFSTFVERVLAENGGRLDITKDSGIFIAF